MSEHYKCIGCSSEYATSKIIFKCPKCNDLLEIRYDYDQLAPLINTTLWRERTFSVWRYRELLPINPQTRVVSLGEGGTGLHTSEHLADDLKIGTFRIKFEGENPTGSFKDRGMTVGISKAIEVHAGMVACASTGNTSASLSAYAARAGLPCIVLIPTGKIAWKISASNGSWCKNPGDSRKFRRRTSHDHRDRKKKSIHRASEFREPLQN